MLSSSIRSRVPSLTRSIVSRNMAGSASSTTSSVSDFFYSVSLWSLILLFQNVLQYCNITNIYNLKDKEFSFLKDLPNIDGHPSITKDGKSIIIDFYQNNFSYRKLISYNIITRKLNTIGFFYDNNYKKNSDVKCDLHSRPSNGNYITIDYPSNDFREIGILKQK